MCTTVKFSMNKRMQDFLQKNLWSILVAMIMIAVAWGIFSTRLTTVEAQVIKAQSDVDKYVQLTERVIVLEEREKSTAEDVKEIKESIKDIKKHFDIP